MIIEDSVSGPNHDGVVDWKDAKAWADGDYNGDGVVSGTEGGPEWPLEVVVLADSDRYLWNTYTEPCGSDVVCQLSCKVTPQNQIFDQGGVTVNDTCRRIGGATTCAQCGYDEAYTESVFARILPPQWCGTSTP